MKVKYIYRKPLSIILLLALWCVSIFGTSIITCCVPMVQKYHLAQCQSVQISMDKNRHQVQWINNEEVLIDGVLYDAVSGNRDDKMIEVVSDASEQKVLRYISELSTDPTSTQIPKNPKQQFKFLPDLFFETDELLSNICTPQNKLYIHNNIQINKGYEDIAFQPPENYFF